MSTPDQRAAAFLKVVTLLRIALVPVIMALVLWSDRWVHAFGIAAGMFAVAALTDLADGFFARRWAQTSILGAFLDTTADKLLVAGALVALVTVDRASPWIAFVIVGRELLVLGLRGAVAADDGTVVTPSGWGKLKANVQFVAIFLALVRADQPVGPWFLDQYAMLAAAVVTGVSGFEYFARLGGVLSPGRRRRSSRAGAEAGPGAAGDDRAPGRMR